MALLGDDLEPVRPVDLGFRIARVEILKARLEVQQRAYERAGRSRAQCLVDSLLRKHGSRRHRPDQEHVVGREDGRLEPNVAYPEAAKQFGDGPLAE